jgi:hypothetical protein
MKAKDGSNHAPDEDQVRRSGKMPFELSIPIELSLADELSIPVEPAIPSTSK